MTYTLLNESAFVLRDADQAFIPDDPLNADWQIYQSWLAVPNTPTPAPPPPIIIPQSVTRRQFYQAAAQLGLITQEEALAVLTTGVIPSSLASAIDALPAADRFAAQMGIVGATAYLRSDPLVALLGAAMGQSSAQIDALFTLAATL